MWPSGISVSAIRITPVSTPLRVRTSVVTAKAMISRLAAIPEAFPADPILEAGPQRSQQSVHSSLRRGGY
jgi:hypothetical protein